MYAILGSLVDYDDEDEVFESDEWDAWLWCPFCQQQSITYACPEDSYGNFYIICTPCHNKYMGIVSFKKINDKKELSQENLEPTIDINYWWKCELAEFTHCNINDKSPEYEWSALKNSCYQLTSDECYNATFLIKDYSEFHFGSD